MITRVVFWIGTTVTLTGAALAVTAPNGLPGVLLAWLGVAIAGSAYESIQIKRVERHRDRIRRGQRRA